MKPEHRSALQDVLDAMKIHRRALGMGVGMTLAHEKGNQKMTGIVQDIVEGMDISATKLANVLKDDACTREQGKALHKLIVMSHKNAVIHSRKAQREMKSKSGDAILRFSYADACVKADLYANYLGEAANVAARALQAKANPIDALREWALDSLLETPSLGDARVNEAMRNGLKMAVKAVIGIINKGA